MKRMLSATGLPCIITISGKVLFHCILIKEGRQNRKSSLLAAELQARIGGRRDDLVYIGNVHRALSLKLEMIEHKRQRISSAD